MNDIHKEAAAALYGIPVEEVTDEQRREAKAISFGTMYGPNFGHNADFEEAEQKYIAKLRSRALEEGLQAWAEVFQAGVNEAFRNMQKVYEKVAETIRPLVVSIQRAYLYARLLEYLPQKYAVFISEKCPDRWLPILTEDRINKLRSSEKDDEDIESSDETT